jgi:homoserine O-acetyltransferase
LVARFDAASYMALMRSMDLHDVGDLAVAALDTRQRVGTIIGVGIDTDILYYPQEVAAWVDAYRDAGMAAEYREIRSAYGHDAFLIELEQVGRILRGR